MPVLTITCGHCGNKVGAEVVADIGGVSWLRCPACNEGSVKSRFGVIHPGVSPDRTISGLPPDVERAWTEARSAHSVGAYTAAEIMCRKILMHVAVDKANAQAGQTFASYISALESAQYITTGLKPVIDQVRQRGNIANHDLPASSEADSLQTITITGHLLEAMYELPSLVASPQPPIASP